MIHKMVVDKYFVGWLMYTLLTMNEKILNVIIGLSLLGIVGVWTRDNLFIPKITTKAVLNPPSPTVTPSIKKEISAPPVPCDNAYFNFKQGTIWKYRVNSKIELQKKTTSATPPATTSQYLLTSEVIESTTGSAVIETRFDNSTDVKSITLNCRTSGIYGLPWQLLNTDLIKSVAKLVPFSSFARIDIDSIMVFPQKTPLNVGDHWSIILPIKLTLPISLGEISIKLNNKVNGEDEDNIIGYGNTHVVDVVGNAELKGLPIDLGIDSGIPIVHFRLGENIGVIDLDLDIKIQEATLAKITMELVEFKEGNNN